MTVKDEEFIKASTYIFEPVINVIVDKLVANDGEDESPVL